ncbi:cation:proton antiporter [Rhizobium sp. FKY42]|uniref:cation:proton antiporter n=1 Tax=Rhizobium sp. FKY42 TaxID=2562310 RepID=UPI0010C13DEB|nr:cation:proton antiporter [Rhizobium sp. FKY42]
MQIPITELFLMALLVIFTLPYLAWRLLGQRSWAPLVVVQIVGGILLGPGVLGAALPEVYTLVFTDKVITALNGIAWWAVMMFVWIAGIELDLHQAWAKRRETGTVALLALIVPLGLGAGAAAMLLATDGWIGPGGAYWQVLLGIGMACAVTALPILVLFMENMDILRSNLGQRILRYASLDDVAIWAVLALILLDWERVTRQAGFLLVFIPAALLARRIIAASGELDRWILGLIWLIACGLAADWAGLHYMVGAFLSGAVLDSRWYKLERMDAFRSTVLMTVMPVFFLSTGLRTSWDMGGVGVLAAAGLLLVASVSGKLIGVQIAGRLLRWEPGEATIIGWLLQTKALIMIIFANILLDKEIITSTTFTALLLMAVGSTMLTMPVVAPLLSRYRSIRSKSEDMGPEEAGAPVARPLAIQQGNG